MTIGFGIVVALAALGVYLITVSVLWHLRDTRRRTERLIERAGRRADEERARAQLRLRIERATGGGDALTLPASPPARPDKEPART